MASETVTRRRLRPRSFLDDSEGEVDPLAGMANLFDVAMVFAVALMVALVSYLRVPALLQDKDYTIITNPGQPDMEIVVKEGLEFFDTCFFFDLSRNFDALDAINDDMADALLFELFPNFLGNALNRAFDGFFRIYFQNQVHTALKVKP